MADVLDHVRTNAPDAAIGAPTSYNQFIGEPVTHSVLSPAGATAVANTSN